jgi:GDPmannose 4,6-dehydratase
LFNHESPLRGEEFVTRKITKGLCEIKLNKRSILELGNLDSKRDWGYAGDYVEGMWKMLQQSKPDDFVLATNKTYTIRDFVNMCCKVLNIKIGWKGKGIKEKGINLNLNKVIIKVNPKYFRPAEVDVLKGSYNKAKKILKWTPKMHLNELAKLMINEDLKRLNKDL